MLRDPGSRGGSAFVHEQLQVGSTVRVRGPRNHFPLISAPRYQFIAGGIGITPLIPMIAEATATGADWQPAVRRAAAAARWRSWTSSRATATGCSVHPQDELGMLDLAAALGVPEPGTLVYCCGPEGLLAAVEAQCRIWPTGSLHVERFSAKPQEPARGGRGRVRAGAAALRHDARGAGRRVDPRGCEDAGISVLGSCYEGICGTCETAVMDGEIDHRDSVLTEEEQAAGDVMMICVSRCKGPRLTLDL